MTLGIAVPVLNNFKGFTELMHSVDEPVLPIVIPNWNENIGVGPAWNETIRIAASRNIDYLIVVNDDVQFRPGLIRLMASHLDLGADLVSPTNETGVCHPHGLNFWCFGIKPRYFFDKFGEFDENFAPAYYEDDDMAYRIRLLGGRMVNLPATAYHQVMGSETDPSLTAGYYQKNYNYYVAKWGGPPSQERYTHPFDDDRISPKEWKNAR